MNPCKIHPQSCLSSGIVQKHPEESVQQTKRHRHQTCRKRCVNTIKYIAAYTQRGFLSERDILFSDGKNVTFRFRSHEFAEDGHCKPLTKTVDAVKFLRLYFQHVLPKSFQRFRYGGIWASCSRAKLHAAQVLLNFIETVDAFKVYIEKAFVPEVRRCFECPNCHCLSSHWIFYNTS